MRQRNSAKQSAVGPKEEEQGCLPESLIGNGRGEVVHSWHYGMHVLTEQMKIDVQRCIEEFFLDRSQQSAADRSV